MTNVCKQAALSNSEFFREAMDIRTTSPQGDFEIREHITFYFTCISKSLPLEQQITLFLKEVYEFKVKEIAEILDISEAMVKYYLHQGRSKMVEIFDRRRALINKEGVSPVYRTEWDFQLETKCTRRTYENRNGTRSSKQRQRGTF